MKVEVWICDRCEKHSISPLEVVGFGKQKEWFHFCNKYCYNEFLYSHQHFPMPEIRPVGWPDRFDVFLEREGVKNDN